VIDWLTKLPDGALSLVCVAGAWFGFNYTVLAERAMERDITHRAVPACIEAIADEEAARVVPRSGIGALLGIPELDTFEARLAEALTPPLLSAAEKASRCSCAIATATSTLRFDYAVHTASFRLLPVSSVAGVRIDASHLLTSGCRG
jgi:hypothetical protein